MNSTNQEKNIQTPEVATVTIVKDVKALKQQQASHAREKKLYKWDRLKADSAELVGVKEENRLLKEQLNTMMKRVNDLTENKKRKAEDDDNNAVPFPTPVIPIPVEIPPPVIIENPILTTTTPVVPPTPKNNTSVMMQDDDEVDDDAEEMVEEEEDDDEINIMQMISTLKKAPNPMQYVRDSSQQRTMQHKAPRVDNTVAFLEHTMQYNSYTNHPSRINPTPQNLNNASSDGLIWL